MQDEDDEARLDRLAKAVAPYLLHTWADEQLTQPRPLPPADRPGAGLTSVLRGIVQALDATAAQLHRNAEHFRALGRHNLARRALQVIFDASFVRAECYGLLTAGQPPPAPRYRPPPLHLLIGRKVRLSVVVTDSFAVSEHMVPHVSRDGLSRVGH
jgi:hypothetical protein